MPYYLNLFKILPIQSESRSIGIVEHLNNETDQVSPYSLIKITHIKGHIALH